MLFILVIYFSGRQLFQCISYTYFIFRLIEAFANPEDVAQFKGKVAVNPNHPDVERARRYGCYRNYVLKRVSTDIESAFVLYQCIAGILIVYA